jgi:hypothetical protein
MVWPLKPTSTHGKHRRRGPCSLVNQNYAPCSGESILGAARCVEYKSRGLARGAPHCLVALWFAHTPPKMPAETGVEFFVLLTTYLVVSLFRALCELLRICPCGIQKLLHNSLFRCTTTCEYIMFESIFFFLSVAGFILLVLVGHDAFPEHRAALLLSWRLTTITTTILTLVCSRDAAD